jgi:hypothetical protein
MNKSSISNSLKDSRHFWKYSSSPLSKFQTIQMINPYSFHDVHTVEPIIVKALK